ncbi:Pycsar system effector family protein [Rhodococcoides corynebacterioides]|uniref:Pycsar system effector family protein n=1 Tax=Rhodococcoides corynebacterioides TaxID=53972 RepID=UPI003AD827A6
MSNPDPTDTAWKIHSALTDWTGKVDTKASFALTIESAVLAGVVTLSGNDRALADLHGWGVLWYVLGVVTLVAGLLCAVWAVRPRLRAQQLTNEVPTNFVYFGHLRQLTPAEVEINLRSDDILPVLSKQLIDMSKISWTKHRLVQVSLTLAPVGVALLGLSATYR